MIVCTKKLWMNEKLSNWALAGWWPWRCRGLIWLASLRGVGGKGAVTLEATCFEGAEGWQQWKYSKMWRIVRDDRSDVLKLETHTHTNTRHWWPSSYCSLWARRWRVWYVRDLSLTRRYVSMSSEVFLWRVMADDHESSVWTAEFSHHMQSTYPIHNGLWRSLFV